jgi:hypothetical protein
MAEAKTESAATNVNGTGVTSSRTTAVGLGRTRLSRAKNTIAKQHNANASNTPPVTSLNRCQPATMVAADTTETPTAPGIATHHRTRGGTTSSHAHSKPIAVAAWPLGKLLWVVECTIPRSGRGTNSLSTRAPPTEHTATPTPTHPNRPRPPTSATTTKATRIAPITRTSPKKPSTAFAGSSRSDRTWNSRRSVGGGVRSFSHRWPVAVHTKNPQTATRARTYPPAARNGRMT